MRESSRIRRSVYAWIAITISLRVTAPGPADARVSVGRRQFSIGRPVEFDDASPHVAALEYALGAVGGEVVNGLREFARRRRLAIDAVEALVTGELEDGLAYLEVDRRDRAAAHPRIAIKVFVASVDDSGHPCAVRRDDRTPAARLHAARGRSISTSSSSSRRDHGGPRHVSIE